MNAQRQADLDRVKLIIASKRALPNEDDKIFLRALMNPNNNRMTAETRASLFSFSHLWDK